MKRNTLINTTLVLVLAACGAGEAGSGTTGTTDPDRSTTTSGPLDPPEEVTPVLTVLEEGGFVPVEYNLTRIPRYVLMSDGTLYGPGMVPAIFPGPALPSVQTVHIDEGAMDDIRSLIEQAELDQVTDEKNDAASAQVADLPDTVFVYTDAAGAEHRFSVFALGMSDIDFGDARVDSLEQLLARLDEAMVDGQPADQFVPESIDVYAAAQPSGFDAEYANTMDWPLDLAFDQFGDETAGYRCVNLAGMAAGATLEWMADANQATTFVDEGGTEYTVVVKPLLPGQQSSC